MPSPPKTGTNLNISPPHSLNDSLLLYCIDSTSKLRINNIEYRCGMYREALRSLQFVGETCRDRPDKCVLYYTELPFIHSGAGLQ